MLLFYDELAGLQQTLLRHHSDVLNHRANAGFRGRLDLARAVDLVPLVIQWLQTYAPANIRELASPLYSRSLAYWQSSLQACWHDGGAEQEPVDVIDAFAVELLLQPFAEAAALTERLVTAGNPNADPSRCVCCHGLPIAATLRERAHGAARALVCGFCLTEWPIHRVQCPACGEQEADALAAYKTEEFAAVRIDACQTCRVYLKTLDLTVDGSVMPLVDDLATLPADLWAAQQGYEKLRLNLLRL